MPISEETRKKWKLQLEELLEYDQGKFDLYDLRFLDSIDIALSEGYDITWRQSKHLSKLYNEKILGDYIK